MESNRYGRLMAMAKEAKKRAYSPYSGFSVGAALLCDSGKIYWGCNVENASYTPTCCAERVAIFSAIAEGERKFCAIAIAADSAPCMPCGVCRQVMSEFCDPDFEIIFEEKTGAVGALTLKELLPYGFELKKQ